MYLGMSLSKREASEGTGKGEEINKRKPKANDCFCFLLLPSDNFYYYQYIMSAMNKINRIYDEHDDKNRELLMKGENGNWENILDIKCHVFAFSSTAFSYSLLLLF